MTRRRLVARTLRFYWRTNLSVALAVVVASGVLTGALLVGDSVQYTLRDTVRARLGQTEFAVTPQNRFFRAALAADLQQRLGGTVAPVLQINGIVTNANGSRRVNRVLVYGVDERFYALGSGEDLLGQDAGEGVVLSEAVARRLEIDTGDELVLRIEKPGLMPRDVPLASDADRTIAFRLDVRWVAGDAALGRFDLKANQTAPLNVFVPLAWLGEQIEQPGRANMLLAAGVENGTVDDKLTDAVAASWKLADADLTLRHLERPNVLELRSRRVFIETSLARAALDADANAVGILTYFVNEIAHGDKATPYSMVTAMNGSGSVPSPVPADMTNRQIVINQWLADDLDAKVGDSLDMTYNLVGAKRELFERTRRLTVADIVPMEGAALDPNLMPGFPGLADVENCRDWEPGIPIDLDKIRPKDEAYWDNYRGTPKAFITLQAGQIQWQNRYGDLTAVRYPWREGLDAQIAEKIRTAVDPASVGLFFQPVRQRGLQAGREGTDFGQLFLGLSMFLIASAVILTGLLFVFGVESRCRQVGLLMAVGFTPRSVAELLLAEGGLVALVGAVAGAGVGLLYTQLMIWGLSTLWSGAVAGARIRFHAEPATLVIGAAVALIVAVLTIAISLRRLISAPAHQLLSGQFRQSPVGKIARSRGRWGLILGVVSLVGVGVFFLIAGSGDSQRMAGAFFGAGALLLAGGLSLCHGLLHMVGAAWNRPMVSLGGLGFRNSTRRISRSLAIVGLLACGVFMVVAVGANRKDPLAQPDSRTSGTGGFAFYGETSVPILHDLNSESGRKALGLDPKDFDGVSIVQFRVHEGDDASCLNLNRAQRPRLLGVAPKELSGRNAFQFTSTLEAMGPDRDWDLLSADLDHGSVPAIGDYPTVFWALGKNIGDEIEYSDEGGKVQRVRIVGMLGSSILQGSLVMAENRFVSRFPSESGYRVFLVDAPPDRAEDVAQTLTSALKDYGLVLTRAKERLAAFSAVENTYLSIFMVLGGLGLVLGSIGLGMVVLRNMLERRGELAMMRAIGFDRKSLGFMVFYEHWGLVAAGLLCGVTAALVAVTPAMQSPGGQVPYLSLALTVGAIGLISGLWVWMAGALALRGPLLDALRAE